MLDVERWTLRVGRCTFAARPEDERPAYLGKRPSRSFLVLRSTTETVVFQFSSLACRAAALVKGNHRSRITDHVSLITLASIPFHSSGVSWSFAAAMFSSRCESDDVPGIAQHCSFSATPLLPSECKRHASARARYARFHLALATCRIAT
jgi:hypothetical protein